MITQFQSRVIRWVAGAYCFLASFNHSALFTRYLTDAESLLEEKTFLLKMYRLFFFFNTMEYFQSLWTHTSTFLHFRGAKLNLTCNNLWFLNKFLYIFMIGLINDGGNFNEHKIIQISACCYTRFFRKVTLGVGNWSWNWIERPLLTTYY